MKTKFITLLTLLITSFSACAGGARVEMPEGLPAPQIPTIEVSRKPLSSLYKPTVLVAKVKDQRLSPTLIKGKDGKQESTISDLGLGIEYAMKKAVRLRGFSISEKAPTALVIKIDKWIATEKENEIVYEAAITADIIGPSGSAIYTSTFDSFSTTAPGLDSDGIIMKLGLTMADALTQILNDENLISVMSSY